MNGGLALVSCWLALLGAGASAPARDAAGDAALAARAPSQSPDAVATSVVLVGRLVDAAGVPVASTTVAFHTSTVVRGATSTRSGSALTDESGRLRAALTLAIPGDASLRFVTIAASVGDRASEARLGEAVARLDATSLGVGEHELGDLVASVPGSRAHLERMDDDALAAEHAKLAGWAGRGAALHEDIEACLGEMVRRGGERFARILETELETARHPVSGEPLAIDLELLTALRRLRGEPDPLAIEIVDAPLLEAPFGGSTGLRFRWRNADVSEVLPRPEIAVWPCRIEAVDGEGRRMPSLWRQRHATSGVGYLLQPGDERTTGVVLREWVMLPHPGDYRVRIECFNEHAHATDDARRWTIARSAPTTVRVGPVHVSLDATERARLRAAIDAIDVTRVVLLTTIPWCEDAPFSCDGAAPEDDLYRAGWKCFPVLLDALEDERATPERRAWILALLWDLTGYHVPIDSTASAVGPHRWIRAWTSRERPDLSALGPLADDAPLDAAHQLALIEKWRACRGWVVID